MPRNHLASSTAACCWIPLFALRCEEARRPELASQPCALLAPDASRRIWQVSPLARRAGAKPGMTVSQAIGLCPALRLCEPDPVHYDEQFARLLAALSEVSPVVEPAELGRAYVGTDGLEGLYGAPEEIVAAIQSRIADCGLRIGNESVESAIRNPQSAIRVGWGLGKFVAWVAASRAKPGGAIIVRPGEEGKFLSDQPLAVLPLDPDTHRRLRQLGLKTLGRLAALPEETLASQFGTAGRRLWRLPAGGAGARGRGRGGPPPDPPPPPRPPPPPPAPAPPRAPAPSPPRHKNWVVSLATRFTGDADQALDVTQETFISLLSKFPGFKLTSRLTTFLYPAVKN